MKDRHNPNLLSRNTLTNPSLNQVTLTETKLSEADLPTKTPPINEADITVLVLLFWITFLGIISLVLFKFCPKLGLARIRGLTSGLFPPVPCRNCRFFANNQYLKCAVHPSTVLTAQATNCSDYCYQDESYSQAETSFSLWGLGNEGLSGHRYHIPRSNSTSQQ